MEIKHRRLTDDAALGRVVAEEIEQVLKEKPNALFCIAAGTTSLPVFSELLERKRSGRVDFSDAAFIGMDEWLGLPGEADGAMAAFLRRHFLDEAGFGSVFLFDGTADAETEILRAERFLALHGGMDLVVFGIGVNGHVALNEPGTDETLRTHRAVLAPITAAVAVKYFEQEMPPITEGITLGLQNAKEAGRILLVANTDKKRAAVEGILRAVETGTADRSLPAGLLALEQQTTLYYTEAVGL